MSSDDFETWLSNKLKSINPDVDLEVFVQYLKGILDDEDSEDERIESMTGLLEEISPESVTDLCKEIIEKYEKSTPKKTASDEGPGVDERLASIMEKQSLAVNTKKELTEEERQRKEAILKHYAQVSDEDQASDSDDDRKPGANGLGPKNANAAGVEKAEREKREKMKASSDSKKAKDLTDREKQKQKVQDRKESEKKRTAKSERRTR